MATAPTRQVNATGARNNRVASNRLTQSHQPTVRQPKAKMERRMGYTGRVTVNMRSGQINRQVGIIKTDARLKATQKNFSAAHTLGENRMANTAMAMNAALIPLSVAAIGGGIATRSPQTTMLGGFALAMNAAGIASARKARPNRQALTAARTHLAKQGFQYKRGAVRQIRNSHAQGRVRSGSVTMHQPKVNRSANRPRNTTPGRRNNRTRRDSRGRYAGSY